MCKHLCLFCIVEFGVNLNSQNCSSMRKKFVPLLSIQNWVAYFLYLYDFPIPETKQYKFWTVLSFVFALLKWCVLCCIHKIFTDHKIHERIHTREISNAISETWIIKWNALESTMQGSKVSVLWIAYTTFKFISSISSTVSVYIHVHCTMVTIVPNHRFKSSDLHVAHRSLGMQNNFNYDKTVTFHLSTSICSLTFVQLFVAIAITITSPPPKYQILNHKTNNSFMSISV